MSQQVPAIKLEELWINFLVQDLGELAEVNSTPGPKVPIKVEESDPADCEHLGCSDIPETRPEFQPVITGHFNQAQQDFINNLVLNTAKEFEL